MTVYFILSVGELRAGNRENNNLAILISKLLSVARRKWIPGLKDIWVKVTRRQLHKGCSIDWSFYHDDDVPNLKS